MTWTKLGTEFFRECNHHGLSDAMVRTHAEAIGYLYDVEESSCRIPKRQVRMFAGSEDFTAAVEGLVALEWWADHGDHWTVIHHQDVIRQSIAVQQRQRNTSKRTSAKHREKQSVSTDEGADGSADVTRHVTGHTDRQTDKQLGGEHMDTCRHGVPQGDKPDSYFTNGMSCAACARERKGA